MSAPVEIPGGTVEVDVEFEVNLPQTWLVRGESPSGVRHIETVRFHFPDAYPLAAPLPTLRPDFSRLHPHIQPYLHGDRIVPCISDVSLADLLHGEGLHGILNQTAIWLDNAALGTLMNSQQGWEPARRDELVHSVTANIEALRSRITNREGYAYHQFHYARLKLVNGGVGVRGVMMDGKLACNKVTVQKQLGANSGGGVTLALVVWPGKNPDGSFFTCDRYLPDDVQTFADLLRRAKAYGCDRTLGEQIGWMRTCAGDRVPPSELVIAVIISARRPTHLMGSTSNIELCTYIGRYCDILQSDWKEKAVDPAGLYEKLDPQLCRRMSGVAISEGRWTLLGAGSLGSKVALHLTRQGMAPSHVLDKDFISAHNAARHALLPDTFDSPGVWVGYKAELLSRSLGTFGERVEGVCGDAIHALRTPLICRELVSQSTALVVNATASIQVREALASQTPAQLPARVIETSLFAQGKIGLLTLEGAGRLPHTNDLVAEFYRLAGADVKLQSELFGTKTGLHRANIGQGCGSATMVMSDALLSAHAATMAQIISQELLMPATDRRAGIWISQIGDDGVSLTWFRHSPPTVRVISVMNGGEWAVHLPTPIEFAMQSEIDRWPGVEAGGILVGYISEVSRTFHIVDLLPAPPDSSRSATLFELGTKNVRSMLQDYSERHRWSLYCLGTWHSHLGSSTPSNLDKLTARSVAIARVAPSLLLIKAPEGYSGLVADGAIKLRD